MKQILEEAEAKMKAVIASARKDLAAIRTGRANPSLLDRVVVEYHGTPLPVTQLATVSTPEPRMLVIQPWDKGVLKEIEKAILKSELGLTPNSDGQVIRLAIPQLTEERRKELVRVARKEMEEKRVAVRNVRRDAKAEIDRLEKAGEASEDEARRTQESLQKLTDKYVAEIDQLLAAKEKEILEV